MMNKKGLTLIEIIISIAILGIVALVFVSIFSNFHRFIVDSGKDSKQLIQDQQYMEHMISMDVPGEKGELVVVFSKEITVDGSFTTQESFSVFLPNVTEDFVSVTNVEILNSTPYKVDKTYTVFEFNVNIEPLKASNHQLLWETNSDAIVHVSGGRFYVVDSSESLVTIKVTALDQTNGIVEDSILIDISELEIVEP